MEGRGRRLLREDVELRTSSAAILPLLRKLYHAKSRPCFRGDGNLCGTRCAATLPRTVNCNTTRVWRLSERLLGAFERCHRGGQAHLPNRAETDHNEHERGQSKTDLAVLICPERRLFEDVILGHGDDRDQRKSFDHAI